MTKASESAEERLAREIVADDRWFRELPAAMKDERSQPNHDSIQAEKGLELARRVLRA